MKYRTLKKIPQLNNEIGDIVDIYVGEGNEAVVETAIKDGFIELCADQSVKNKHFLGLMKPMDIKLQVLKTN